MTPRGSDLDPLFEILGHRFADPQLLAEALTHPSAHARRGPRQNYERLEFLGDRVLGLVVAELLWRRFPDEAEGELTRRHTGLVRRESLVQVARALGLGPFVILSPGEAQAGARDNGSVLADTCEAVIAALYLDGGLEAARGFVHRCWEPLLQGAEKPPRDPKTALQEWAQGRGRGLPVYETVSVAGPAHKRVFTVSARVEGAEPATASGSSKRAAETAAAAELIARLTAEPNSPALVMSEGPATRCGYVALIGAPNSGKSTLLNALVGAKVSIVSPKVQTTRRRVLGIAIHEGAQMIFVDTPGIFAPRPGRRLERAMVSAAWAGAEDADLVVLLVDVTRPDDADTAAIVDRLKAAGRKAVLGLNKIDRVQPPVLLGIADRFVTHGIFDPVFMISGLTGDGVGDLKRHLAQALPEGPWLYPEDQLSDLPERLMAAEATREQIFLQLRDELPYATTVETDKWEERKDGSVRIEQTIFVQRPSQKAIMLGEGGQRIKQIGARARAELEAFLGRRVHLFLHVRVEKDWTEDRERYEAIGLDFES